MNSQKLSVALREIAGRLDLQEDRDGRRLYADEAELICVLARLVEGKTLDRSFGPPGDWGYNHPIGRALAAPPDGVGGGSHE